MKTKKKKTIIKTLEVYNGMIVKNAGTDEPDYEDYEMRFNTENGINSMQFKYYQERWRTIDETIEMFEGFIEALREFKKEMNNE